MIRGFAYGVLIWFAGSCSLFDRNENGQEEPIARVYDKYLYTSDLKGVGSGAVRPEDSLQAVRNYIDSWIRHNILLRYAEDNLPDEDQRLTERLQDYRESLLIYAYEKELLSQKLDTTVSDEEIRQYYFENHESFTLKSGISQIKYIMLKLSDKLQLDSVRNWMRNSNEYNYPKLAGFCKENAVRYTVSDSIWYNKEETEALLPVNKFNLENAQYNKSYVEVVDSGYAYLIKFNDYRIKGSDAPVDFVKDEITGIIINQRKNAYISSIHKSIYEEALKNDDFQVYFDEANHK